jgi:hypothetical protein
VNRDEVEKLLPPGPALTSAEAEEFAQIAELVADRYPIPDDDPAGRAAAMDDRQAALEAAREVLAGADPEELVCRLGDRLRVARANERDLLARLRQVALMTVDPERGSGSRGVRTARGFARLSGVDRFAVLDWLGLRRR